jgi:diaminopimelate decarboxylase
MSTITEPPLVDMDCYPDVEMHRSKIQQLLQHDGTPVFICERDNLVDRYQALKQSVETHWGKHVIAYSFKTNYLVARARILQDAGAWAEVVSEREYKLARQLEYPGSSIIFNGPLKPDDSLRVAIADGALININDHDELDRLIEITSDKPTRVDVGIRISSTFHWPQSGIPPLAFVR